MPTGTPTPVASSTTDPKFVFGSGVDAAEQEQVKSDIRFLRRWSAEHLGFETGDFTVYWFYDVTEYVDTYLDVHRRDSAQRDWYIENWANGAGHGGDQHLFICTCDRSLIWARDSLAHEYFHVLQLTLSRKDHRHGTFAEPAWLIEGSATYLQYVVSQVLGIQHHSTLQQYKAIALGMPPLENQETQEQFFNRGGSNFSYAAGAVATKMLADIAGLSEIMDHYALIGKEYTWREAFEEAFGLPVGEFYELFEEHKAAGFPDPACEEVAKDSGLSDNGPASPDREALVTLFNATCGLNWQNSEGWLTAASISEWHGITVDVNNRITGLDLSKNGLFGQIPPELGGLAQLEWLHLPDNGLGGEIPTELGNLTKLTRLLLSGNLLVGEIPPEVGNLENLESMWLTANRLSGQIPPELGDLANLWILQLSGNQLTGPIPPELGNLDNLQYLRLSHNQLTGPIPKELSGLTNLKELRLDGNQLSGCLPGILKRQLDPAHDPGMPFC